VWKENHRLGGVPLQTWYSIQSGNADEFGVDCVYQLAFDNELENNNVRKGLKYIRAFHWNQSHDDSVTVLYFDVNKCLGELIVVSRMWAVPFQNACIVLVQNTETGKQELLWLWMKPNVPQNPNIACWAINHNTLVEHSADFVVHVLFDTGRGASKHSGTGAYTGGYASVASQNGCGDLLSRHPVLVTSADTCNAVVLDGKIVLVFDFQKLTGKASAGEQKTTAKVGFKPQWENWRGVLTDSFCEPRHHHNGGLETVITASCYVLDSFLLLATNDGVLWARPRTNPKSEYFVETFKSLIPQMTSLFNVVAFIHSYHVLEVRLVVRQPEDPFIRFATVYQTNGADCERELLLYGPYVIFAGLDGCWYRVLYDNHAKVKEELTVPGRPGWRVLSVKNATWSYLTLIVQDTLSKRVEEVFLLS
jgi:hypothetical protein